MSGWLKPGAGCWQSAGEQFKIQRVAGGVATSTQLPRNHHGVDCGVVSGLDLPTPEGSSNNRNLLDQLADLFPGYCAAAIT